MVDVEEIVKMIPDKQINQFDQAVQCLNDLKNSLEMEQTREYRKRVNMQTEIRTLEFWRAVIAECIGTFFLVFMICSLHQSISTPEIKNMATIQIYSALTTGLAVFTLTQLFLAVSGAHFNPAVSIASLVTNQISILRTALYICAQCGGSIAGAALVFGIHGESNNFVNGSVSNLGMEFLLTFVVVFAYFSASNQHYIGGTERGGKIGLAYMAALSCYNGGLNPAMVLGPSFVANKFDSHWIFWLGPILGGICGALTFKFIFNISKPMTNNVKELKKYSASNEDDMIDDLEKVKQRRLSMFEDNKIKSDQQQSIHNTSLQPFKHHLDSESAYGGTKSLYNFPTGQKTSYNSVRKSPGIDCSKSAYGEECEKNMIRKSIRRSLSTNISANQKRNPNDNLPDAPDKSNRPPTRSSYYSSREESNGERSNTTYDSHYSKHVGRQHYSADQNSGSSSGYYSGKDRHEVGETGDLYDCSKVNNDRMYTESGKERIPTRGGSMRRSSDYKKAQRCPPYGDDMTQDWVRRQGTNVANNNCHPLYTQQSVY